MERLVTYFSGSRVFGTDAYRSDLDKVEVYKHRLVDILRGVVLDDWDYYPKYEVDMYEIQKFLKSLHWGNSFLYATLAVDAKEQTSELWEKFQNRIVEVGRIGVFNMPYNRRGWVCKNLHWFRQQKDTHCLGWNAETLKRVVWIYYWTLQAIGVDEKKDFRFHAEDVVIDSKYGEIVLNTKRYPEEFKIDNLPPVNTVFKELEFLDSVAGSIEGSWDTMNNVDWWRVCDLLQEIRTAGTMITVDNPEEMRPGKRTSSEVKKNDVENRKTL